EKLLAALERRPNLLPASALYAWATLDLGWPYINFTPSLGATFPAALELAQTRKTVCGGQDGKTGETLLKTVLAPMFAQRNFHIQGFLGVKMMMQFTWQGCDSILAAPLVLDLARLALHAQRRGEVGVLRHLACFFKDPMGVAEHDFFKQWAMLEEYVKNQ